MQSEQILIVCVVAVTMFILWKRRQNKIDAFVKDYPPTQARFGLRGDRLRVSDIRNKYIWPESHFRMVSSGGMMYESRNPPHSSEGACDKVDCPSIFGRKDGNCWYCR